MPITLNGDTGITTPSYGGAVAAEYLVPVTGFKNRIINGDMSIDQRNNGSSVTQTASAVYTLDRWQMFGDVTSKFSIQQNAGSVTPPSGFTNYLGVTSLSAYTLATDDRFFVRQKIEGFNTADLNFGKATATPVTLSFWVRSSLTGTFGGSLQNGAGDRSYPFTFTINSANTWEYETITIAGDTSGTWLTTNGIGLVVNFGLGVQGSTYAGTAGAWNSNNNYSATGATSVVSTNGATFYITGVQLEKGANATSFDYLPYGTELQLCQRYYQRFTGTGTFCSSCSPGIAWISTNTSNHTSVFQTEMRTAPTLEQSGLNLRDPLVGNFSATISLASGATTKGAELTTSGSTGLTTGRPYYIAANSGFMAFNSEL